MAKNNAILCFFVAQNEVVMNLKAAHLILLLGIVGLFNGCRHPEPPPVAARYQADFHVRYIANQRELRGQADFKALQPEQPAPDIAGGVAFWGSSTQKKTLPGNVTRYEQTSVGDWLKDKTFQFQLPDATEPQTIPIQMDGITRLQIVKANLREGIQVNIGTSLRDDESLVFLFTDPTGENRTIIRPGPLTTTTLLLPADATYHFVPGAYMVYAAKTQKTEGTRPGLNYRLQVEFYSEEVAFSMKE